jgi:hypothetical protein
VQYKRRRDGLKKFANAFIHQQLGTQTMGIMLDKFSQQQCHVSPKTLAGCTAMRYHALPCTAMGWINCKFVVT